MPSKNRVPRFYFSFRSPYSWLAHHDLTQGHPEAAAALEWRPFWEPDEQSSRLLAEKGGEFSYVAMSRDKHLYILQDVRRLTRERGLEVTWPVDRDPVWEVPHLAYLVAADEGLGPEFIERVYRARWLEGRDICAPATIAGLAAEFGLPEDRCAKASEDDALRERGTSALLAIHQDGVFGVPFFVRGFDKFWGLDRLPAFLAAAAARPAAPGPDASPLVPGPSPASDLGTGGDRGHAGGCG